MVDEQTGASGEKTADQRRQMLAQTVAKTLAQAGKWRVESQTDYNAILVKGKPVNHVLHLILSIISFGIWLIVWIIMAISGGEKRFMLTVDAYGNISNQQL